MTLQDMETMMTHAPVQRNPESIEEEALHCGAKRRARFKMLFSADRTATNSLTCGVASVGPGRPLAAPQARSFGGLLRPLQHSSGDGRSEDVLLSEGTALFIPGNVEHAIHADGPATFFFAFAADSYSDVQYVYLDQD